MKKFIFTSLSFYLLFNIMFFLIAVINLFLNGPWIPSIIQIQKIFLMFFILLIWSQLIVFYTKNKFIKIFFIFVFLIVYMADFYKLFNVVAYETFNYIETKNFWFYFMFYMLSISFFNFKYSLFFNISEDKSRLHKSNSNILKYIICFLLLILGQIIYFNYVDDFKLFTTMSKEFYVSQHTIPGSLIDD